MAILIDGKQLAQTQCELLRPEITALAGAGQTPGLAVILAGENIASEVYVRNKEKRAASLGINGKVIRLPATIAEEEIIEIIQSLNHDAGVHGILVQLPLPGHLNESAILSHICPQKDVDGFHPVNGGALLSGKPAVVPCTPLGIMKMLESIHAPLAGAHTVVVGRSNIVGKPVSLLLQLENATVTMCHSYTKDLACYTRQADILVAAAGRPHLIKGDMLKPGAIVIDVGMNTVNGKLTGDVAFDEAAKVASYVTPVPGGVGPMTIAMLMYNTVQAAKRAHTA
ncbi:MAG: bifunctional 5,10-methylenetetrahydrofolate dehydrogenase/5,10-methenyltetrahydrofolate cyclohydrolase [Clostridiales bacterium]|jgi:methylenetetrahydrofolate dehydrogenase (NADP+)/methenyltetrahydrofolate cyclohydrolase|nr:bifunctional 5,10-methylenetetrahydrofolate dehydrogenase/5,10-methenyltetrahydrofolate cyclohydrolase [Clostridiales bacterium]